MRSPKVYPVNYRKLPLDQLVLAADPIRAAVYEDSPADRWLLDSVTMYGMLIPIVVEQVGERQYRIVDGQRRYLCAKKLDSYRVPCMIYPKLSKADRAHLAWVLNCERKAWTKAEVRRDQARRMREIERRFGKG